MGTKVVASDIPVFREVGGQFASYFNPDSIEELVDLLSEKIQDSDDNSATSDRISFARQKSWKETAAKVADAYKEIS